MSPTPPRVSEKIETDAIDEVLGNVHRSSQAGFTELRNRARAQLARLKAAAQERDEVVEECASVCALHSFDLYEVSYAEEKTGCDSAAAETRSCAETAHDLAVHIRALKSGVHRAESEEGERRG